MPPHSLLSLLPTASISPRTRRAKHRAPAAGYQLCSRLPVLSTRAPSLLHSLPSSSPGGGGGGGGGEELHLLDKPSPSLSTEEEEEEEDEPEPEPEPAPALSTGEALAPYLNFFQVKGTDTDEDTEAADGARGFVEYASEEGVRSDGAVASGREVIYYDPKPGDLVAGVVVGGDGRKLDVDVGAGGEPALMLTKEAVLMPGEEFSYLACDVASKGAAEFAVEGRVGVVVSGAVRGVTGGRSVKEKAAPVVGVGTVVFAEVLGRTPGGRPLLSARRLFRRVAWHRVRQIKQLNIPIKVKIFEWNAGGLLSRIEGLRAFLPKPEMMTRPRNFTDLKNNVGRQIHVCITRTDERTNELIISEKEAWALTYPEICIFKRLLLQPTALPEAMAYIREGALLEGTVCKLFPYGAQIRIGETNRSGLLHISKISKGQLRSVGDVLKVGEKVKALVIKPTVLDRIALSIKDLESEPGLFLSDKEKVFSEAEEMAQRYRDEISETPRSNDADSTCDDAIPFEDEAVSYANWKWLKFNKSDKENYNPSTESRS